MLPTSDTAFAEYLRKRNGFTAATISSNDHSLDHDAPSSLRKLSEVSDLPASEFADEVARFHDLPRIELQELLSASALVNRFSRRFLREMSIVPFRSAERRATLAMFDPTDDAAIQAARIVLGEDIAIVVASVEDITTALDRRLDSDESAEPVEPMPVREKISKVCAISRAVRRWCVPSTICWSAPWNAGERHPYRAVPDRTRRAHAGRRDLRCVPFSGDARTAGRGVAYQDPGRPQHRGTPVAAGWCRASAGGTGLRSISASPPCRHSTARGRGSRLLPRIAACWS